MNIINAMFSTVFGGVEQVFLDYNAALSTLGHELIAVMHTLSPVKKYCQKKQARTVFSYGSNDPIATYRLKRLIQKELPDAVITHTRRAAVLFHQTKTHTPKIAVCHDPQLFPLLNKTSDAIIAITETMRQDILATYKPTKTILSVPNMIHLPEGVTYTPMQQANVPVIGTISRFSHEKGIHVFLESLKKLKENNIRFSAKIAGEGKLKKQYAQQIKQLQLQQEVALVGFVDDKEAFYRSLNIFCLPSFVESFGLTVLESMMYSIPMLLTKVSGPTEIIGKSNGALFVNPNDPEDLAQGLVTLIQHHEMAQRLAQNAFQRLQDFSAEKISLKLHDAIVCCIKELEFRQTSSKWG